MKLFVAVKAIIEHENKVLIIRESSKYIEGTNVDKFDIPGGRINPEQSLIENLKREILEETGLIVNIGESFFLNEVRPIINGEETLIVRIFFKCSSESDKVKLSDDHDKYEWINSTEYRNYKLIENLIPVFEKYNSIWQK